MNDYLLLYGLLILFIIGYCLVLSFWDRKVVWRLSPVPSQIIKVVHYSCVVICCFVVVMYAACDIGLRGIWTTRVVGCVALVTGVFFNAISSKEVIRNSVEQFYFGMFSFFPPFLAFLLLFPILQLFFVLGVVFAIRPVSHVYYDDSNFRIQGTPIGFMVPSREDVFEKRFIFEKRIETDIWSYEVDSVRVSYDTDSTRIKMYGEYIQEGDIKGYVQTIVLPQ